MDLFIKQIIQRKFFFIVLIIGLLHGLIYVFLIPPWQHYDEPGHFEYVWMIANHDTFPQKGEYDNAIRREILDSLKVNRFFTHQKIEFLEQIVDTIDPVWIGVTQVGDPPLYYFVASLPLRTLKNTSLETQLYSTRIVSLLIFLLVLWVAWQFAKEVSPVGNPFRYLLPLTLALIPGFVDHLTALNNDGMAVLINSLLMLFGVRLFKNERNWRNILLLILFAVLAFYTKSSIWLSIIIVFLAIFFSFFRKKNQWIAIAILALMAAVSIVIVFEMGDVAYWFRNTNQIANTKVETEFGSAIQIIAEQPNSQSNSLYQTIPLEENANLKNKVVTLGSWIWGEPGKNVLTPFLMVLTNKNERVYLDSKMVILTGEPVFYATHFQIPENYQRLFVVLQPFVNTEEKGVVYYQYPVMSVGEFPTNISPIHETNFVQGTWYDNSFENIIRNSSLEDVWPKFRPSIVALLGKIDYRISEAANWLIYSLDIKGTGWYIETTMVRLFRTFWGQFGWGNVSLIGHKPYRLLLIFSILSAVLSIVFTVKKIFRSNFLMVIWLLLFVLGSFFFAWFTGISMQAYFGKAFAPVARFIYPSILVVMSCFVFGWSNLLATCTISVKRIILFSYMVFFILLDILAIYSNLVYYSN
jgi:hypothetical protein